MLQIIWIFCLDYLLTYLGNAVTMTVTMMLIWRKMMKTVLVISKYIFVNDHFYYTKQKYIIVLLKLYHWLHRVHYITLTYIVTNSDLFLYVFFNIF